MNTFSAQEQSALQSAAVSICDQVCQIYAKVTTKDAYSSQSGTWPTLTATTVARMAEPTGSQLQNYDFMIGSLAAWHVRVPLGTVVHHQDHLVIGDKTLEVQVILEPHSHQFLLSLLASEIV